MKLHVVTNKHGKVIATARIPQTIDPNIPSGGHFVLEGGQQLHEVTLPPELNHIQSAAELHEAVSKLIKVTK